jgi:hypothetical protein
MKRAILFACVLAVIVAGWNSRVSAQAPTPGCAPAGGLTFICGVQNPEDLVIVPNTSWLVASGMAPGSGLHVVDTQAKAVRVAYGTATSSSPTAIATAGTTGS